MSDLRTVPSTYRERVAELRKQGVTREDLLDLVAQANDPKDWQWFIDVSAHL